MTCQDEVIVLTNTFQVIYWIIGYLTAVCVVAIIMAHPDSGFSPSDLLSWILVGLFGGAATALAWPILVFAILPVTLLTKWIKWMRLEK